jgi:hypothetical protein
MKVLRETEVSLAFDGGNNVGMLALFHAAQATIKRSGAGWANPQGQLGQPFFIRQFGVSIA